MKSSEQIQHEINYQILKRRINYGRKQYMTELTESGEITWESETKTKLKNFKKQTQKFNQMTKHILNYVPLDFNYAKTKAKIFINSDNEFVIEFDGKHVANFKQLTTESRLQIIKELQMLFNPHKIDLPNNQDVKKVRKYIKQ